MGRGAGGTMRGNEMLIHNGVDQQLVCISWIELDGDLSGTLRLE